MTLKVLIVDDSKLARMAVIRALTRLRPEFGYAEAANPDEALAVMKAQQAEIAIVDYNMPGRDGLMLTSELKAIDPGMAVAVLSANAQTEIISGAEQLGATFLTKPLAEPALDAFLTAAQARK
jgi:DNA-binding NarL/FixJ family response regulator